MTARGVAGIVILALAAVFARAQAPDRTVPPSVGKPPGLRLPSVVKWQLPNGLSIWIVEHHEVPVAQVSLVVKGGTADDPAGQYGIASMTAALLPEGAGTRSALEIADAIEFLGASLSTGSAIDSAAVRLYTPVARLADALPLMADVALRPTFPAEELERVRQQRLTNLLQARDDPATIASLAYSRVLYGRDHRFGTATAGLEETIRAFTPEQIRAFYDATYRPDRATLLVVGDVTVGDVIPLLTTHFGQWKGRGDAAAEITLSPPPDRARREVYLVDKPGAPQAQIRIGSVGVARSTPDYFPLQVLNTILGGSFSSRLNLNLRERNGYAYSAGSFFDMRESPGPFMATAAVQTDRTGEALTEFFNELRAILEPVPEDELERAKNYVALRFPGTFETTGDIARRLEDAVAYALPDDYFARYVQQIQAVSAEDVQRVARRYIRPDRMAVVVVGDRTAIEEPIRALKLGPVSMMTVDELFDATP
jgi:predicted Zn-dependent peptidase